MVRDKWNYDERERKEEKKNRHFHFEYSIFHSLRLYLCARNFHRAKWKMIMICRRDARAAGPQFKIDEDAQAPIFLFLHLQRSRLLTSVLDALSHSN